MRSASTLTIFLLSLLLFCTCDRAQKAAEEVIATGTEGGDTTTTVTQLEYLDLDLPDRHYLVLRQELALADVNGFIGMESEALMAEAARQKVVATGPLTMLTYAWDTERGWSDLAIALPVAADAKMPPYVNIKLPATKAIALDMDGGYEALSAIHVALNQELNRRGLTSSLPAIEEYPVGPLQKSDPHEFRTRIIYPYQSPAQ